MFFPAPLILPRSINGDATLKVVVPRGLVTARTSENSEGFPSTHTGTVGAGSGVSPAVKQPHAVRTPDGMLCLHLNA